MWEKGESVQHITSRCKKLAQKEYKRRHDNVAKKVHWDICKKNRLEHSEKWYEHVPEGAVENEENKVLWDINIQCDNLTEARRPDLIVIDKKEQKGIIIDIAVPADVRVEEKEKEKGEKFLKKGFEKRDQKIVEIEKCRNCRYSDRGSRKCFCRIWYVHGKAMHNMQCWSNAEVCLVENCKNTKKSIRNIKTKTFC